MSSSTWVKSAIEANYDAYSQLTNETMFLPEINLSIKVNEFEQLLAGYNNAVRLAKEIGATFKVDNKELFISIDDLIFNIQTAEDLFILTEIYVDKCYNFSLFETVNVIDIGMNVAYASLYFSHNPKVNKVYSFEPFEPTYQNALKHLSINPSYSAKIIPHNYGVGVKDEVLQLEYSEEQRGRVGIKGTELIKEKVLNHSTQSITLKSLENSLVPIFNLSNDNFIIKMDCEGSEYGIIEKMNELKLFKNVKGIMIEWHEKGPDELIDTLNKNGFVVYSLSNDEGSVGMIYAAK